MTTDLVPSPERTSFGRVIPVLRRDWTAQSPLGPLCRAAHGGRADRRLSAAPRRAVPLRRRHRRPARLRLVRCLDRRQRRVDGVAHLAAQPQPRSHPQQSVRGARDRGAGRQRGRNRHRAQGEDRQRRHRQDHRCGVAVLRGGLRHAAAPRFLRHADADRADDGRERRSHRAVPAAAGRTSGCASRSSFRCSKPTSSTRRAPWASSTAT